MLDRDVGLARPVPENAADIPAAREARVERQRTINQRHHRTDVLAERGQREGGIGKGARIVAGNLQGAPGEIGALAAIRLGVLARTIGTQPLTADRGPSEGGPVTRVALDRLFEETERCGDLRSRRQDHRMGAQR